MNVNEFKTWLDGVESMQDPDWHPTAHQWRIIREKITNLEEAETLPVLPPQVFRQPRQIDNPINPHIPRPGGYPVDSRYTLESELANVPVDITPPPSSLPANGQVEYSDSKLGSFA